MSAAIPSNQARALLEFWTGQQIPPDTMGELTLPAEEGVAILIATSN